MKIFFLLSILLLQCGFIFDQQSQTIYRGKDIEQIKDKLEKLYLIRFPKETQFIVFSYHHEFQDDAAYLKVRVPIAQREELLRTSQFNPKSSFEKSDRVSLVNGFDEWTPDKVFPFEHDLLETKDKQEFIKMTGGQEEEGFYTLYLLWFQV